MGNKEKTNEVPNSMEEMNDTVKDENTFGVTSDSTEETSDTVTVENTFGVDSDDTTAPTEESVQEEEVSVEPVEDALDKTEEDIEQVEDTVEPVSSDGSEPEQVVASAEQEQGKEKKAKKEKKPKKVKEPKKPKVAKQSKPKKKLGKKAKVGIIAGAVVLTGGIIAFNVLKDDTNFYSVAQKVVNTDVGSFRFVVDVRTAPHGEEKAELEEAGELSQTEVENTKSDKSDANESAEKKEKEEQQESKSDEENIADQVDTTEGGKTWDELVNNKGNVSDTWGSSTGASFSTWEYPNYQLVVEGCTTQRDPVTSVFDISLVTENINEKLTTVTIIEDNMYVDLEQMKYYLTNSQDSYFIALADELPENAKNMVVPLDEVEIPFLFSEDGEKTYETDVMNAYHRFATVFSTGVGAIEDSLGSKGLSKQDDKYSISLSGKNANKLVNTLRGFVTNRSGMYDRVVNAENNNGYLNEKQLKQLVKGKDNFLAATDELYRDVLTTDLSNTGLELQGTARKYKGGTGIDNFEASMQANFTVNKTDYTVALSGSRTGQPRDIKVPSGSKTDFSQKDFYSLAIDIVEHLNITGVDLDKKLAMSPDMIANDLINDFVDLVNTTDSTSTKISEKTAVAFIERYANYEETSETTSDEKINAQLVADFLDSLKTIIPDEVFAGEDTNDLEQFRKVVSSIGDVDITANFNQDESSSKLGVIDVTLENTSDEDVELSLENFSLQTMLSSKYPCNNYTTLHDYDNKFDKDLLKSDITVKAGEKVNEKLYVILNNGMEYMELFYDDEKLGEMIIY